jgi:predicted nucleotidyltransferase
MKLQLYQDFKDFLLTLNKHQVKYIVVGGYAVVYHGYNRNTGYLDIWVEQTSENFDLLMQVFSEFGLPLNAISKNEFLNNRHDVYTFGVPPVCIEILTAVKGIQFAESFSNSLRIMLDGIEVNMIDVSDLIRNKKAVGRNKDLDDIEHIE